MHATSLLWSTDIKTAVNPQYSILFSMKKLRNYITNSQKQVKEKLKHIPFIDKLIRQRNKKEIDAYEKDGKKQCV